MRNPKIVLDVDEADPGTASGNPGVDCFYVDMNGLIHPCCNPQTPGVPFPTSFEEQCQNIANYLDRLVNIVRPQRLLYLAIDGVAPRAKMIQQRSRRFRAALERRNKEKAVDLLCEKFRREGAYTEQMREAAQGNPFDSNVITPGTVFLHRVCQFIAAFVLDRMNEHPLWAHLQVILSDANVPGEGEHKIMEFIRQQRAMPGYDPNTRHCLYGADADLLMLGLATH